MDTENIRVYRLLFIKNGWDAACRIMKKPYQEGSYMRKYLNRVICFAVVLALVATSRIMDITSAYGVSMIQQDIKTVTEEKKNVRIEDISDSLTQFAGLFNVTGLNKDLFSSKSVYFRNTSAYADDDIVYGVTGFNTSSGVQGEFDDALKSGESVEMKVQRQQILLCMYKRGADGKYYKADFDSNTTVAFSCDDYDEKVVAIRDYNNYNIADSNADFGCTIVRKGPGGAAITAIVTNVNTGKVVTFSFYASVGFEVDRNDTSFWMNTKTLSAGETPLVKDRMLVIDTNGTGTKAVSYDATKGLFYYQLQFNYLNGNDATSDVLGTINAVDYDETVVKYVATEGRLYIIGAGNTHVTLQTETLKQKDEFDVIVRPLGSFNDPATYPYKRNDDGTTTMDRGEIDPAPISSSTFTIFTNATKAENLDWRIYRYDQTYNNPKQAGDHYRQIDESNTAYYVFKKSSEEGFAEFTKVKAGSYKIELRALVYATGDELTIPENILTYYFTVLPVIDDKIVYLNVDNEYDIRKDIISYSNLPEEDIKNLYYYQWATPAGTTPVATHDILSLNTQDGTFKALKYGTEYVGIYIDAQSLADVAGSKGIFDTSRLTNTDLANVQEPAIYTVNVIDNISISDSGVSKGANPSFSIYVGEKYPLYANVSNKDYPVYWESLDEDILKIESVGDGKTAYITGSAIGQATVRAYQIINNVERNAYATVIVKDAVNSIVLDPSEITLKVDANAVIVAKINGSTDTSKWIDDEDIKWVSKDEGVIFSFEDGNTGKNITIKGLKPGKTTITAINRQNIVVGYCVVNVIQYTGLTLYDSTGAVGDKGITLSLTSDPYQLYAYIQPENNEVKNVTWETTNNKVVTVSNGLIKVVGAGEAMIVCKYSQDDTELVAYCTVKVNASVKGITLDEHSIEMNKGESYRLAYVITPDNANNMAINVTSFNTKVATATASTDKSIVIKGAGAGTTQIMVMTADGNYYDLVEVTVKSVATAIKMDYTDVTLGVGEYFDMTVTYTPNDAVDTALTWESLDTKIATVSSSGRIQGVSEGDAVVLCRTQSGVMAYCNVHVYQKASGMTLDPEKAKIDTGETIKIDVIFDPATTTNQDVTWTSSDPDVCTVNEAGQVTGLKGGVSVITCRANESGLSAFCLIYVEESIHDLTLDPEEYILGHGDSFTIKATMSNEDTASSTELLWYSEDESIATVDEKGKVYGTGYGDVKIWCEALESDARAYCNVQVVKEVEKIKLNYSTKTIIVGHSFTLTATVSPADAYYKTVNYAADDDSVVIVDEDGVVTGIKPGSTFVRATAKDNSGKNALCFVTVINEIAATGITLSDTEIYLLPGETKTVTYTIKPANSTDSIKWSSSDDDIMTVSSTTGKITAKKPGIATATIMTKSGKTATVTVHVLGLSRTYLEIPIYSTYTGFVLDGADAGDVRWDVTDIGVCDLNNGTITARKLGSTSITATYNGRTLKATVKVVPR